MACGQRIRGADAYIETSVPQVQSLKVLEEAEFVRNFTAAHVVTAKVQTLKIVGG
jgi:hypothetical protein